MYVMCSFFPYSPSRSVCGAFCDNRRHLVIRSPHDISTSFLVSSIPYEPLSVFARLTVRSSFILLCVVLARIFDARQLVLHRLSDACHVCQMHVFSLFTIRQALSLGHSFVCDSCGYLSVNRLSCLSPRLNDVPFFSSRVHVSLQCARGEGVSSSSSLFLRFFDNLFLSDERAEGW